MKDQNVKEKWMNDRMEKGYSFTYYKDVVNGENINTGVKCVETGEQFYFDIKEEHSIVCPKCGRPEISSNTLRTVYLCGSSDYDQRPGTFNESIPCLMNQTMAKE